MKMRVMCVAAALGLGTCISTAEADSNWLGITAMGWQQSPGWFVAPGIEGGFQRLPRWTSPLSLHFPAAFGTPQIHVFSRTPAVAGADAGLTVGYVLSDGALPPWLGSRVRIAVTGTWQAYRERAESSFSPPGLSVVQYIGVDGRVMGGETTFGATITEILRTHREGFDFNLRAASDFPLRSDLILTPSIAVFGGRTSDSYEYSHLLGAPFNFRFFFDERVRTTSVGGDLAFGLTWQATSYLALNATARGGVVWMHSRLQGADCFTNFGTPCVPAFPVGASVSTGTVTDSASRLGFRGGMSLGAALDMRFGILSVGGSFTYDSAIPGILNPGVAKLTPFGNVGGARIRFGDNFRYGGFLNLRVPLLFL